MYPSNIEYLMKVIIVEDENAAVRNLKALLAEARQSEKYQEIYTLLQELEGLGDGSYGK